MKPDIGRNLFYMLSDLPKLALQSNVVHGSFMHIADEVWKHI